jgi:hypothetical protein
MALQSSGSISLGQVNTELNKSATASISLNDADVRNLAAIVSGQISMSNFYGKSSNPKPQQKAIFGFGVTQNTGKENNITNIITNTGVVGTDTPNTGIALPNQPLIGKEMAYRAAAGYGGDKAIFGFGYDRFYGSVSYVNRVSNTGVLASTSDLAVGRTGRQNLAAAGYGGDKAIFGFGDQGPFQHMTNLVSNTGVVATDVTGVGTKRTGLAAAGYGGDKAIFAYGNDGTNYNSGVSMKNLVSNAGVVAADVAGVGTRRKGLAAVGYGLDKALFAYGAQSQNYVAMQLSNLVTNTGVVGTDNSIAGRGREYLAGTGYGGDKGIFGYGNEFAFATVTNLVSNTGVVASELIAPGVGRYGTSGACFG